MVFVRIVFVFIHCTRATRACVCVCLFDLPEQRPCISQLGSATLAHAICLCSLIPARTMGKRQLKIADAVTPRKKQAASSYRLSQLEGTGSPASQIQVPADKLRIEVRKYIDNGSVYNAHIYAAKPLFQYILSAGQTGETKKYLFRLKDYMSLFFEEKYKNDDTIPPNWNAFEQIFGATFNFVSKNHDDVDRAGHRKGCCGFYGTHDVKEFLLLLDDVFAFRTSLGTS